jgi:chromosome segregation ATPase
LLKERVGEITTLKQSIDDLSAEKTNLSARCDADRQRIEDLEFQIEEHMMGVAANANLAQQAPAQAPLPAAAAPVVAEDTRKDDESIKMVLTQLDLQKKLNETHLNEVKLLNKQIDDFKIEIAQLRLGEEVHSQERIESKKRIDALETEVTTLQAEIKENEKLKENFKVLELNLKVTNEEYEKKVAELTSELKTLSVNLHESENQKTDLEFLYQENMAKLTEANQKHEEKVKEFNSLLSLNENVSAAEKQRVSEIEFTLEEHKIQVQDLETRLSELTAAKAEQSAKVEKEIQDLREASAKLEAEKSSLEAAKNSQITELVKN